MKKGLIWSGLIGQYKYSGVIKSKKLQILLHTIMSNLSQEISNTRRRILYHLEQITKRPNEPLKQIIPSPRMIMQYITQGMKSF